jgi:hypothetical protein
MACLREEVSRECIENSMQPLVVIGGRTDIRDLLNSVLEKAVKPPDTRASPPFAQEMLIDEVHTNGSTHAKVWEWK